MSCPICGCSNFETILSKPSIPIFTNAGDKGQVFNKYPCKLDQCKKCGHGTETTWEARLTPQQALPACPSCGASSDAVKELSSHSIIDSLTALAEDSNSQVTYISVDTEEGSQLMQGFGGLAAILRYPMM